MRKWAKPSALTVKLERDHFSAKEFQEIPSRWLFIYLFECPQVEKDAKLCDHGKKKAGKR